jgi:hypothetical protein
MSHVAGVWRRSKRAIHNLIDGVNRFPFAGTAAKNEDARDKLKMSVIDWRMAVILAVL